MNMDKKLTLKDFRVSFFLALGELLVMSYAFFCKKTSIGLIALFDIDPFGEKHVAFDFETTSA